MLKTERAFWDTSAIVPLCLRHPFSASLRRIARDGRVVAWWGTAVEATGAIIRLRREGALDAAGVAQARQRLTILRRGWSEILPTDEVRSLTEAALDRHELRAADALQLAAALVWCAGRPRRRPFVCLDERLASAAARDGFEVLPAR